MKKIITGLALILATTLQAQDNNSTRKARSNAGLYFGTFGTPQTSWMQNKDDKANTIIDPVIKFGASFGLAAGYNFTDNIGVEIDALYSLEGKRYKIFGTEYNQSLAYVKVPVMFTFASTPATVMFLGKIGPQLGVLTNAKIDPIIANGTDLADNRDHFRKATIGGVVNAGARFSLTDVLWLDVTARYDATFNNTEDDTYIYYPVGGAKTYNMTAGLQIGVNYLLQ